jgi:hypothetical protein
MGQDKILSYTITRVLEKFSLWFPQESIALYDKKEREAILLVVTGVSEDVTTNPMQTLRIPLEGEGEAEVQVTNPRMVHLSLAVIPCFEDVMKSLDLSALIKRNMHDDPYLVLEDCLWHGCSNPRLTMEFCGKSGNLPASLAEFESFRWDLSLRLGINSAKEEKIVKVRERQFTAVKK